MELSATNIAPSVTQIASVKTSTVGSINAMENVKEIQAPNNGVAARSGVSLKMTDSTKEVLYEESEENLLHNSTDLLIFSEMNELDSEEEFDGQEAEEDEDEEEEEKLPQKQPKQSVTFVEDLKLNEIGAFNSSDFSSDSLDSFDSFYTASTYLQGSPESESNFFEKLAEFPDLNAVKDSVLSNMSKTGKFVDPLTGGELTGSIDDEITTDTSTEEVVESEIEEDEFDFYDFDAIYPKTPPIKAAEQGIEAEFIWNDSIEKPAITFWKYKPDRDEMEDRFIAEDIERYLQKFFDSIVTQQETKKQGDILRSMLNKRKLFEEVYQNLEDLEKEKLVEIFLNRKATNHFRRKGQLQNIAQETEERAQLSKQKLDKIRNRLDVLLGQEETITQKTEHKISVLSKLVATTKELEKKERTNLNELIRRTLCADTRPALTEIVNTELKNMAKLRSEISEVRSTLIRRQDTLSRLKIQIEELNNIGNDLRIANFVDLNEETRALSKKVEDRNTDLKRLHSRLYRDINTSAHYELKRVILHHSLGKLFTHLNELKSERCILREQVLEMKLRREKLHKHLNELSLQSGLLDKPALLLDYDATVEKIEKKRKSNDALHKMQYELETKLKKLEIKPNNRDKRFDNSKNSKRKIPSPKDSLQDFCENCRIIRISSEK